jgi:hypothetical protein
MAWIEVFLAERGEHFDDGRGRNGFGKLDEGFHVEGVRDGTTVTSMYGFTPEV